MHWGITLSILFIYIHFILNAILKGVNLIKISANMNHRVIFVVLDCYVGALINQFLGDFINSIENRECYWEEFVGIVIII